MIPSAKSKINIFSECSLLSGANLGQIMDLAATNNNRFVVDRHSEPPRPERDASIDKDAAAVRAAMGERVVHRSEYVARLGAREGEPGYATHYSAMGLATPITIGVRQSGAAAMPSAAPPA
jgi:hypothetical protein